MLPPPRSRKIVLSEAARSFIDLEAAFLRRSGFEVLVATDGAHALSLVEQEAPELCVLDLAMGAISGDEVVRQVRSKHKRQETPHFILVSAGGGDSYERCLRSGADEIFTDPWSKDELLRKAAALLRIPRRAFARVLVRFEVEGERENRVPFFGSSVNISRGGVLLETLEKLESGTELRLGFFLPGYTGRIGCRGSIVRREPSEGGFNRYGVRFVDVSEADARAVDEFVKRRE